MGAFDGRSKFSAVSEFTNDNPTFKYINKMKEIGGHAFKLTFPGMIKDLYGVYKVHHENSKELKEVEEAFKQATALAEKEKQSEAIESILDTLSRLDTAGEFKDVTDELQDRIRKAYEDMLKRDAKEYNSGNAEIRDSILSAVNEMKADADVSAQAALEALKPMIDDAFDKAEASKTNLSIPVIEMNNRDISRVMQELKKLGIPAQAHMGEPFDEGAAKGIIIAPLLPDEAYDRIIGIASLVEISYQAPKIETRDQYDVMAKVMGSNVRGASFTEHLELSGLTVAEAEFMRNRLYKGLQKNNFPVAVIESSNGDGTMAVLYPKEAEKTVNQAYATCLLMESGFGKESNFEQAFTEQARNREKVQGMITMLARDNGDQFIIVDPSETAGRSDDKAKMPDHYLRIEKGFIKECKAKYNEKEGKWAEEVVDYVNLSKPQRGRTKDDIIQSKVNRFAKDPVILGESQAEKFGITRDSFEPTEKFISYIQKTKNPNKARLVNPQDYSKEERGTLSAKINAQRDFANFASRQAVIACRDNPSIEDITNYVARHTDELIEQFKTSKFMDVEKKAKNGRDTSKDTVRIEATYKLLKEMADTKNGVKDCATQAAAIVDDRVITQIYEPDPFTAAAIDSAGIDEKEIFDIQRAVARARAMAETPIAENSFQAAVMNEKKKTLDDKVVNYKMVLRRKNPNISEAALDTRAAAFAFTENLHDAVFKGTDFAEDAEATSRFGFDFGQAARNIDETIYKQFGFHVDELQIDEKGRSVASKEDLQRIEAAKKAVDPAIRKEVTRQMTNDVREQGEH